MICAFVLNFGRFSYCSRQLPCSNTSSHCIRSSFLLIKICSRSSITKASTIQYQSKLLLPFSFHSIQFSQVTSSQATEETIDLLRDIVAFLRKDRLRPKEKWHALSGIDYNEQMLSSDRHKLGRKAFKFCELYSGLPSLFISKKSDQNNSKDVSERQEILEFLLSEAFFTETQSIDKSYSHWYSSKGINLNDQDGVIDELDKSLDLSSISLLQKLKRSCTPLYEDLICLMLEMAAGLGLQCIINIRQDVLLYRKYLKKIATHHTSTFNDDPVSDRHTICQGKESLEHNRTAALVEQLDMFDNYLRQTLTIQFAPGFLDLRRITYHNSPAATIEMIAKYEAVHPVQGLQDLRARLGPDRRVFGLFHPKLIPAYIPAVVLYISLQSSIPSSMDQIHNQEKEFLQTSSMLNTDITSSHLDKRTVAAFYSISNLQAGLAGVGLGEYLIKQSIKELRQDIPSLNTFVTISPLPNFRKWLETRAIALSRNTFSTSSEIFNIVNQDDISQLANFFRCEPNNTLACLIEMLETQRDRYTQHNTSFRHSMNDSLQPPLDTNCLHRVLCRLAAHYLVKEKHRQKPFDSVARFHVSNGAEIFRINVDADMSRKGWHNSFGIMVNYKYNLDQVQSNQDRYELDFNVPIHENILCLLN